MMKAAILCLALCAVSAAAAEALEHQGRQLQQSRCKCQAFYVALAQFLVPSAAIICWALDVSAFPFLLYKSLCVA